MTVFLIHKKQKKLAKKLPTVAKIVKYRLLSAEPIRLQDFEDSARSQAWKKIYYKIYCSFWGRLFLLQSSQVKRTPQNPINRILGGTLDLFWL